MILWDSRTVHCNIPALLDPLLAPRFQPLQQPSPLAPASVVEEKGERVREEVTTTTTAQQNETAGAVDTIVRSPPPSATTATATATLPADLLRLVGYICMQPRNMATADAITTHKQGYLYQIPTSHWATAPILPDYLELFQQSTNQSSSHQRLLNASPQQLLLAGFTEYEITQRHSVWNTVWYQMSSSISSMFQWTSRKQDY
jgi:hypothetical protein